MCFGQDDDMQSVDSLIDTSDYVVKFNIVKYQNRFL